MSRTAIPKNIKDEVITRNGGKFCQKCGRKQGIQFHHIQPVQYGGTHAPENLAMLCCGCHQEWHGVNDVSTLSFTSWLEYPPCHQIIASMMSMEKMTEKITGADFVTAIKLGGKLMKQYREMQEWQRMNPNHPPDVSGIYGIKIKDGDWFYIGQSANIRRRIAGKFHPVQIALSLSMPFDFFWISVPLSELDKTEDAMIDQFGPIGNGGTSWNAPSGALCCDIDPAVSSEEMLKAVSCI